MKHWSNKTDPMQDEIDNTNFYCIIHYRWFPARCLGRVKHVMYAKTNAGVPM